MHECTNIYLEKYTQYTHCSEGGLPVYTPDDKPRRVTEVEV